MQHILVAGHPVAVKPEEVAVKPEVVAPKPHPQPMPNPSACKFENHKKPPVPPHLPPKPSHPVTIHYEPSRPGHHGPHRPEAPPAGDALFEPEYFGGDSGSLAGQPCMEEPVTSDSATGALASTSAMTPGSSASSSSFAVETSTPNNWGMATATSSSSSGSSSTTVRPSRPKPTTPPPPPPLTGPVAPVLPVVPVMASQSPGDKPYAGPYVLNLAGPSHGKGESGNHLALSARGAVG